MLGCMAKTKPGPFMQIQAEPVRSSNSNLRPAFTSPRPLRSCLLKSDTGFDFGVLESDAANGQLNVAKFLHFGEQKLFFE